jgi:hypothetical protein
MQQEQPPEDPPPVDLDLEEADLLAAFWDLSASRTMGFSAGPIPVSEVLAYCRLLDVEEAEGFFRLIRTLDAIFLGHLGERQARQQ